MTAEDRDPQEQSAPVGSDPIDATEESELVEDEGREAAEEAEAESEVDELFDLDRVIAERDEYLDSLRRVQAEFDNYRKRMVRQQTELLERASESLLERLLPVLDALDLALAHRTPADAESSEDSGATAQIAALLRDTLTKEGLERIDEVPAEFDPTIHDAVAHAAAEEDEPDEGGIGHRVVVTEVLRAGYRLKGRVLRPAMVKVQG
jgi:molecular chaperone GrpE